MKKLSLLFAMMAVVSFAVAQTATINQTSNNAVSMQKAEVSQQGNSFVTIAQVTNKIHSDDPVGDPAEFNNTATVRQSGADGNRVFVEQKAEGNIWGTGANTTSAVQIGGSNTLYQTQLSGNHTSGGMNFTATQIQSGNYAEQYSKKTEADFDLYQDGTGNKAYQKTTGEKTGVLAGMIQQIGSTNTATQLFHGENVRWAGANIDQNGSGNTAQQEFDNSSTLWNDPSKADIIQRNSGNYAYQSQFGQGSYQYTSQLGSNNQLRMWSNGNFNTAYSMQNGTDGNISIEQKQDHDGIAASLADGNVVRISQDGNGSYANIKQDGLRNSVEGLQGTGSFAINNNDANLIVTQTGQDNVVRSYQVVAGSETVTQMGINNLSIVNQY